ncbi:MAG: hypothetical protein Gyms2KO_29480 [Gymnodinialimonas sp.]
MPSSAHVTTRAVPMRTPFVLLLLSTLCGGASYVLGGPTLTLPLAVSGLAGVAAFLLLLKAGRSARKARAVVAPKKARKAKKASRAAKRTPRRRRARPQHVVVDGSNVMHWNGEVPRLATLKEVIAALKRQGYQPGVIFDANAGYKLSDRYLDDRDFAKLLNLPGDRVLVVDKGEPADPTILAAARELGAKVVTNDRFRHWVRDFPEVLEEGHLLKGGFEDGKLWFDAAA